jgi:hypothetical protein
LSDGDNRATLVNALQQWAQGQQQPAIDIVRPLAEADDEDAIALLAWMFGASGRAIEGVEWARKAADMGALPVYANYGPNLISQGQRAPGIELLRRALAEGWPHDPLAYAQQAAQQGDTDAAFELLRMARQSRAENAVGEIGDMLASARTSIAEIQSNVSTSAEGRDRAMEAMKRSESRIEEERARVESLVDDVTRLVHGVAAEHLAEQYAKHANDTETTAKNYTKAAIAAGVTAAIASVVIAIVGLAGGHDVSSILSKALLTLPVIALAGYFGGLARSFRRMAWHWRHVELQIRTAEPYLAPLADEPRKTMLAALALRFFPGQALNPQSRGDTEMATDTPDIVAALTRESRPLGDPPSSRDPT